MNRWWDDAESARNVLEAVDGSNVEQGVGTAALGLHALSRAAVAPLAADTLVDAARLHEVLAEVDYAPVAAAIARATEQVMGEASEAYGQMLAAELHAQGSAGAQQMVAQLTAAGVPMPLALERLSHVVGVPAGYAGRFTEAMKAEAVPDIVAADAGDRALMTYAAHQGRVEAQVEVPVTKADAFEEAEHPRDEEGKFAQKPDSPPRLARMARRKRRAQRAAHAVAPAPAIPANASLADLANLMKAPVVEARGEQRRGEQRRGEQRRGESLAEVKARTKAPVKASITSEQAPVPELARSRETGHIVGLVNRDAQTMWVPRETYTAIRDRGVEEITRLMRRDKTSGLFVSEGHIDETAAQYLKDPEMMLLRISGQAPIVGEKQSPGKGLESVEFASQARFRVTNQTSMIFEGEDEAQAVQQVPVLDLTWDNEHDFDSWHGAHFGKADEVWEDHQHHAVERDEQGQFAEHSAPVSPRAARMARRARRARRATASQQTVQAKPSLGELASLVRAPAAEPRGEQRRGEQRRGEQRRGEARAATKPATAEASGITVEEIPDGTAAFQSLRTWTMPESDARQLLSDAYDAIVVQDRLVDQVPVHGEWRTNRFTPFDLRKPDEALAEWARVGSDGNPKVSEPMDRAEAEEFLDMVNEVRFETGGAHAPLAYLQKVPGPGDAYEVVVVHFDPGTSPVTFVGTPEALVAMESGEEVMEFTLTARDSHSLAEAYDADPAVMGDQAVPCVAITVAFPHDEKR